MFNYLNTVETLFWLELCLLELSAVLALREIVRWAHPSNNKDKESRMNIHHTLARPVLATLAFFAFALSGSGNATTILSFEGPLPPGLVATSYLQGTAVPNAARVTDQYLSTGLVISGAALVNLGVGHAPSGTNGLAGIDGNGNLDYDSPLTFSFFMPGERRRCRDDRLFCLLC